MRIRFWNDVWWGEEAFSTRFANLYRWSLAPNCTIAEFFVLETGTPFHRWDLHFYRNLHARELENFVNSSAVLDQVRLNDELADLRIWNLDRSGGFSCKSATATIQHDDGLQDFQFHKFIWKSSIPTRIKLFAWSLCLERINTYDVLQRKRPFSCLSPTWCVLCKQDQKSILHLFIQCDYARFLWIKIFREFGVTTEIPNNFLDLLKGCPNECYTNTIKALWLCVIWAIL